MRSLLEASETNSIVSLPSARGYVMAPRFLTMEPSGFKSVQVGHCSSELYPEKTTHCHALEREEAARFATLQSAPGFYFEPIAR